MHISFDRGTLLLDGHPSDVAALGLPEVVFDERVHAFRAPAFQYAALAAAGTPFADAVRIPVGPCPEIRHAALRGYQRDALDAWEMASRRGVVVLPTGSGKTLVAIAAAARVRGPTLVLVPTRVLLDQWRVRVSEATGAPDLVGTYGDGKREVRPFTIVTYESAYRHLDEFGNRFELLVVDEAHHFGGGVRSEALEMCTAAARLGLTATPPSVADGLTRLRRLIGPVVFELRLVDLVGGVLVDGCRRKHAKNRPLGLVHSSRNDACRPSEGCGAEHHPG